MLFLLFLSKSDFRQYVPHFNIKHDIYQYFLFFSIVCSLSCLNQPVKKCSTRNWELFNYLLKWKFISGNILSLKIRQVENISNQQIMWKADKSSKHNLDKKCISGVYKLNSGLKLISVDAISCIELNAFFEYKYCSEMTRMP